MNTTAIPKRTQFAVLSRILHWLMAALLLAMLMIGIAMVTSLGNYHALVAIHRPLGILILILAVVRLINRFFTTLPPFPPTMLRTERFIASWSERLLYALMLGLPLVGWGMLSAGNYPVVMFGSVHLPSILPSEPMLYAALRKAHSIMAYLLFFTFLAHLAAVLFHTLVIRDRLLDRMALWPTRARKETDEPTPSNEGSESARLLTSTENLRDAQASGSRIEGAPVRGSWPPGSLGDE